MQSSLLRDEITTHPSSSAQQVTNDPTQHRSPSRKIAESSASSPSPSFIEDLTEAMTASLPIARVAQSTAEKARERRLRADPMANVLGPLHVDCKICGARIKLSSKSLYDTCHWDTHRTRCLKRNKAKMPLHKRPTKTNPSHLPQTPARFDFRASHPATEHKAEGLVPEAGRLIRAHQNTSHTCLSTIDVTAQAIFGEYLLRFHGENYKPPTVSTDWRDWSWSQLLYPRITAVPESEPSRDVTADSFYDDELLYDPVSTAVF